MPPEEIGSLEVGQRADPVVLDRNLFETGPGDIHEAKVLLTLLDGEVVYSSAGQARRDPRSPRSSEDAPMTDRELPAAALPERLVLADGRAVTLRAIRPEDAAIEQAFVRNLSPRSRHLRFLSGIRELTPALLAKFTHTDYPSEAAFIATIEQDGREEQIGVARFAPGRAPGRREFAVVVADEWQGRGIATALLRKLFRVAVDAGMRSMEGLVLRENARMLALARDLGFETGPYPDDPSLVSVRKEL